MSDDDMNYFERRAREERERAAVAADICARKAHERIAAEYELLAKGVEQPTLRIVAE